MALLSRFVLFSAISAVAAAQSHHTVVWDRSYGGPHLACGPQTAAVDANGSVWVVCRGHDYDKNRDVTLLYRIDSGNGDLKNTTELNVPLPTPLDFWQTFQLVSSGSSLSLLSSGARGGRMQTFDGVFRTPLGPDGTAGATVRVVPEGSQLQESVPTGDGGLLIAADQGPPTIRKIGSDGRALWVNTLGWSLDLSDISAFPDGSVCFSAEPSDEPGDFLGKGPFKLALILLGRNGRAARRSWINAAQGALAAGPNGICALLYSDTFTGTTSKVRFAGFDKRLQRLWDVPTSLKALGGREYMLIATSDGYFAFTRNGVDSLAWSLASFSLDGRFQWADELPPSIQLKVVMAEDGLYLVEWNQPDSAMGSTRVLKIRVP